MVGEVADERNLDALGIEASSGWNAIETGACVHRGYMSSAQQSQRATQAKAAHSDLSRRLLEVLHRTPNVLPRRVGKVQVGHQMAGLIGGAGDLAAIKVRHKGPVTGLGQTVGCFLNLIVQPPPL